MGMESWHKLTDNMMRSDSQKLCHCHERTKSPCIFGLCRTAYLRELTTRAVRNA
uniref:Uncharacterized protein n=1 Tax=Arundo donax TaxID=35708 RepID=A0A0A9D9G5_ARUDO